MNIELPIGQLAEYIEEFSNITLVDNTEIDVSDLRIKVPALDRLVPVNWFIKKEKLPMMSLTFNNGYTLRCAKKHILQELGNDIYAKDCVVGSSLDHLTGQLTVVSIDNIPDEDCYDFSIDAPHLYYDANGLVHHNTIMTASLSKSIEAYGRSIIIVPNISLVTQTEADYINMGLDVGVYFGGRKEIGKTHTICTWQSLNNLLKNTKAGEAEVTIQDFLEGVVCVIVDECLAAGTMIQTPKGQIPIEQLVQGDKVISYDEGERKFVVDEVIKLHTNLAKSVSAEMFEFELEDGSKIQITGNHKVLTDRGWVEANQLEVFDNILSFCADDLL